MQVSDHAPTPGSRPSSTTTAGAAAAASAPSLRTARTTVVRRAQRGVYDRPVIDAILDEALVCHLGFVVDGQPYVLPTTYARVGDEVYVHGSAVNRMLRTLAAGVPACMTVTLLDGLVLARSAFHHSMNYRSVVLLGVARPVTEAAEKRRALEALVEHVLPGRFAAVRPPSPPELQATLVLALPITEASAKIRSGPPIDDAADLAMPCWAGEIPLRLTPAAPVADPSLTPGLEPGPTVTAYRRPA
jgi:uncharacterized protein